MRVVSTQAGIDVAIVGGGAAGLATGIFIGRAAPGRRVVVLDGARTPGAKILVSGGSRCNVTNTTVTERDFNTGRPAIVRNVLRAFPATAAVAFFRDLGVGLHEEALGKLFPDSNRSRDVLDALLRGLAAAGGHLRSGHRVHTVTRTTDGTSFDLATSQGPIRCTRVVLATGGLSLPKTGSDGGGYALARTLGHTIVDTTPALVPLCFAPGTSMAWQRDLSGISHPAALRVTSDGRTPTAIGGALLWTHFGVSGPAVLDVSRHWLRHRLEGREARIGANLIGTTFEAAEAQWASMTSSRPRQAVVNAVASLVPAAVAAAAVAHAGVPPHHTLADLPRAGRRAVLHALTDWPLPIADSRGYNHAEVTAGGVPLEEINPSTMESRLAPGVHFVGEILDVDGRLGGFNFQWAWSSAHVAATGIARL